MSQHKSILLVINGTSIGGTETALAQIASKLLQRGHHVEVMSLKKPGEVSHRISAAGVLVLSLNMTEKTTPNQMIRAALALRRRIDSQRYDIVHSFLPRANIVSRVANRMAKGTSSHVSSERSTDFNRARTVILLNRLTARWTDLILAVSPAVRTVMINRDRLPGQKISILENGLDLAPIDRQERGKLRTELSLQPTHLIACSVGRLVPDKGHHYLIDALRMMNAKKPEVHLVLIGDGDRASNLRRQASELDLTHRVHFLGVRSDVPALLKAVDIFVLPSLEEGTSVALLEAMACSLPIIATRVGGNAEVLDDGETGILVRPAEVWGIPSNKRSTTTRTDQADHQRTATDGVMDLAAALDRLAQDHDARIRLGRNARKAVENRYDLEQSIAKLDQFYDELAGSNLGEIRFQGPPNQGL